MVDTWSVAFDLDPAQTRNSLAMGAGLAMLTELINKPEVVYILIVEEYLLIHHTRQT